MRIRLLSLLCLVPSLLWAQRVSVTTQNAPVDVLTINDVDFLNSTTPKWLFTIELATLPPGQTQANVVMEITTAVALATGERYDRAVYMRTVPFTLEGSRTFTNLDFSNRSLVDRYESDPVAKSKFQETALPSGTLPAGRYDFVVTVSDPGGPSGEGAFAFFLTNPSGLKLLIPLDGETTANEFPLFQWQFDGIKSRISIFEKLPGQMTLEEAASGVPHLTTEVAATFYQYPSAAARALEAGKTYVWFVEGLIRTTGGVDQQLKSPLRSFIIGSGRGGSRMSLLDQLEQGLDPKYKPLFDQIREGKLTPVGAIVLDGMSITTSDFLRLVSQ